MLKKLTVHKHDCFHERGGTGVAQPTEAGRLPTLPKAEVGTALEHWIVHTYSLWSWLLHAPLPKLPANLPRQEDFGRQLLMALGWKLVTLQPADPETEIAGWTISSSPAPFLKNVLLLGHHSLWHSQRALSVNKIKTGVLSIASQWEICEVSFGVSVAFDLILWRMHVLFTKANTGAEIFWWVYQALKRWRTYAVNLPAEKTFQTLP